MKSFLSQQQAETRIVCGSVTVVDEDGRAAREFARREIALYLPVVAALDPTVTIETDRLRGMREAMSRYDVETAVTFISDELLSKFAFAGTPEEISQQVLKLFEAGADRVEFGTPHGLSSEDGLALLGDIVLPYIQEYQGKHG